MLLLMLPTLPSDLNSKLVWGRKLAGGSLGPCGCKSVSKQIAIRRGMFAYCAPDASLEHMCTPVHGMRSFRGTVEALFFLSTRLDVFLTLTVIPQQQQYSSYVRKREKKTKCNTQLLIPSIEAENRKNRILANEKTSLHFTWAGDQACAMHACFNRIW